MSKKFKITPIEKNSNHFFNIAPASEFVPEWYRKSPSTVLGLNTELIPFQPSVTSSTYKKCTPFLDALTMGYMVFLSADIEIIKDKDGTAIRWRTERDIVTEHAMDQWKGLPCPEGYFPFLFKWHNQFSINIPKEYSLLFISPINRFDLPFITVNGIVDSDAYNLPIHFPFFIKDSFEGIIEKNTPITQIIPIKRDNWEREYGVYDENYFKIENEKFWSTIKRSYKNNFWHRKEYK
jgi:hypothetical protein